jgi:hypothetical protein
MSGGSINSIGLTIKQQLFVEHYLQTRSGFRAAKLAGYAGVDYTLRQVAAENLAKPAIRAEIDRRLKPLIHSSTRVLAGLAAIADADSQDVFEDDGSFDFSKAKERGITRLIKSLAYDKDTGKITKVELHNAHEGLRDLGKFHKIFVERVETEDKTPANSTKLISDALQAALESLALKRPDLDLALSLAEIEIIAQVAVSKAAGGVTATEDVSESDSKAVN